MFAKGTFRTVMSVLIRASVMIFMVIVMLADRQMHRLRNIRSLHNNCKQPNKNQNVAAK